MHTPRFSGLLLALVVASTATGCGAATPAPSTRPAAEMADVSLAELARAADELDHLSRTWVAACMDGAGYPELRQAAALAQPHDRLGTRTPLVADPLEAGPYTEDMARRYGLLGTAELFRQDEPGYVLSEDADHDRALADCRDAFDKSRDVNTARLLSDVAALGDDAHSRFLEAIEHKVSSLLEERINCVRNSTFPALTADIAISLEDLLGSVGIAPGKFTEQPVLEPPAPSHPDVSVTPPDPIRTYAPSPAEVEFALAYVRCGNDQDFVAEWESAQVGPRREIEAAEMSRIQTLAEALDAALSS